MENNEDAQAPMIFFNLSGVIAHVEVQSNTMLYLFTFILQVNKMKDAFQQVKSLNIKKSLKDLSTDSDDDSTVSEDAAIPNFRRSKKMKILNPLLETRAPELPFTKEELDLSVARLNKIYKKHNKAISKNSYVVEVCEEDKVCFNFHSIAIILFRIKKQKFNYHELFKIARLLYQPNSLVKHSGSNNAILSPF